MSTLPVPSARSRLPRLQFADYEFLPAALEVLETPLSPVRTWLIAAICAFVTSALIWCWLGQVDIIATAQGKFQPVGRTKTIQSLETGKVLSIPVQNGSHVKAGDVLVVLDPGQVQADEAVLEAAVVAERAEAARRAVALALASNGTLGAVPQVTFPAGTTPPIALREQRVLAQDVDHLATIVASLEGQVREKSAERDRLRAVVDAQSALVATLQERVDMRQTLFNMKIEAHAKVIDALETLQSQQATLASERGQIGEIDAALARLQQDIRKSFAAFGAENAQKLAETGRLLDENLEKLNKAHLRTAELTLHSPVDGTVTGSSVTSVGQVITVGEQIMQIVPGNAKLEIECYLPNGDIGFVREGQTAVVKVDSFPFTDYGTINARVIRVAHDAIPQPEAEQREQNPSAASKGFGMFGGAQRVQNLFYPVTLEIEASRMHVGDAELALVPGMAVTVEIKTGMRRIISYFLSPVMNVASTALRER